MANEFKVKNGLISYGDIIPDGVHNLGTVENPWNTIVATNISGSVEGNASTVTDGVYTVGDQLIQGVKSFGSFPFTPELDPVSAYQVVNKKYVDDNILDPLWDSANSVLTPQTAGDKLNPIAMPISGDWSLSGNLNIEDNLLYIKENSRQIGINTIPTDRLHIFGTDNSASGYLDHQFNSIILDGVPDGDKQIILSDNGTKKWAPAQIFRDENGSFLYTYSYESEKEPFLISTGGRVGINRNSNIMDYHSYYMDSISGALNDMDVGGFFELNYDIKYQIAINTISGTVDTFHMRHSRDGGTTWNDWHTETECSSGAIDVEDGVTVTFENSTGHNLYDAWEFTAFAQLPQSTFEVNPSKFVECLTTTDYSLSAGISYTDVTYNISNSIISTATTIIPIGDGTSNKGAVYFGMNHKFNSMYMNIITPSVNCSLILEYWNGSAWTEIDGSKGLKEETNGLVDSGLITYNISLMTGWAKTYSPDHVEDGYNLYWVRLRSSTIMTTAPTVRTVVAQGDKRFAVYAAHLDSRPSFYIDTLGGAHIQKNNTVAGPSLEILDFTDLNNKIAIEKATTSNKLQMNIYNTLADENHKTAYMYGEITFATSGMNTTFKHKFDNSFNFYNSHTNNLFNIEADGTLSVGNIAYETLVVNDNDIPNKKYVDEVIGGMILNGSWDAETNTPDITGTTESGNSWIVSVSGNTDLGGITPWYVGEQATKTPGGWIKINPIPAVWGSIIGQISDQDDLVLALSGKISQTTLDNWAGSSNITTLGTIGAGTWQGNDINKNYLDDTITTQSNTFNGVSQLVQTTNLGKYPALSGDLILGIPRTFTALSDVPSTYTANAYSNLRVTSGASALEFATLAAPPYKNQFVRLTANITNNSNPAAYADVTGLSFAVEANKDYFFQFDVIYQSTNTGNGIGFAVNGPASPTSIYCKAEITVLASAANNADLHILARTYDGNVTSTSVDTVNVDTPARISGILRNGANAGTLTLRFRSEGNSIAVSTRIGSIGRCYQTTE